MSYLEAWPQLLLQAFLQRVVHAGGRIEREYGLGRMRTDLFVEWPLPEGRGAQRFVIELKRVLNSPEAVVSRGAEQTREYMGRCGAREGHLVVFDRRKGRSWEERIFRRESDEGAPPVTIWGV